MIRYFLIALGALLAAAGLGVLVQRDPGYMLLAIGNVAIETSFWVALLLFLLLLGAGYYLLRLSHFGWSGGSRLARYLGQRRQQRSNRQSNDGLIALVEGNYDKAKRLLTRHLDDVDEPLLNYLGAAYAANALGDPREASALLARAERNTQGANVAIELVQARLLLQNGRLEESLASLTRAQRNTARHPAVLRLLKSVYLGLEDWDALLALLPDLKKHGVTDAEELETLRRHCILGQLKRHSDASKTSDEELAHWWHKLPKDVHQDDTMVASYVRQLISRSMDREAEDLLRKHLRKSWQRELVELYGKVAGPEPDKQLLTAEAWLPERTNDASLLLTLGRLSLRNQLWGKAREYFDNSYRLDPGHDVCAELGRLLAYLGEHERSAAFFQESLQKSGGAIDVKLPSRIS
ncbi:heme biosynthesis HemY N-terminal domain-containing protein [Litorivivens sp.]|uniref:heme biosynthesis HemY N-terminal domain-containing protein n=1 Tax=Litorivivens sp. TaxID=2020868 RepID=UPI003565ADF5